MNAKSKYKQQSERYVIRVGNETSQKQCKSEFELQRSTGID